jgi:hypothetical protein
MKKRILIMTIFFSASALLLECGRPKTDKSYTLTLPTGTFSFGKCANWSSMIRLSEPHQKIFPLGHNTVLLRHNSTVIYHVADSILNVRYLHSVPSRLHGVKPGSLHFGIKLILERLVLIAKQVLRSKTNRVRINGRNIRCKRGGKRWHSINFHLNGYPQAASWARKETDRISVKCENNTIEVTPKYLWISKDGHIVGGDPVSATPIVLGKEELVINQEFVDRGDFVETVLAKEWETEVNGQQLVVRANEETSVYKTGQLKSGRIENSFSIRLPDGVIASHEPGALAAWYPSGNLEFAVNDTLVQIQIDGRQAMLDTSGVWFHDDGAYRTVGFLEPLEFAFANHYLDLSRVTFDTSGHLIGGITGRAVLTLGDETGSESFMLNESVIVDKNNWVSKDTIPSPETRLPQLSYQSK